MPDPRAHNGDMARLEIRIASALPAPQAWARILDLRAHSAVIPLTTVTGATLDAAGRAEITKTGRVVHGRVHLTVSPTEAGSEVLWRQTIRVTGVPPLADPVVSRIARAAYSRTLRALLRRR